ncbi:hypothetical protein [Haloplanus aerogenes]|uniref:Uncharacterized protein n=1 Tax=Haloplanus aerogenes TaxID=660522 RepID=A0A3M0D275_9EURY|nr:hypothetical protein [Haloplanus aerogenes]AZH27010.1 hypothetical protein DU502_17225 [Haloplanus aerogenes]RMB13499.1 hypothetical protein ATH50_2837 [Haloplanus aerogenes]
MGTHTFGDDLLPSVDSPLDAVDTLLTGGGVLGVLTYVVGLLVGNVEAATLGVWIGVACVLGTLTFRSVRGLVRSVA